MSYIPASYMVTTTSLIGTNVCVLAQSVVRLTEKVEFFQSQSHYEKIPTQFKDNEIALTIPRVPRPMRLFRT